MYGAEEGWGLACDLTPSSSCWREKGHQVARVSVGRPGRGSLHNLGEGRGSLAPGGDRGSEEMGGNWFLLKVTKAFVCQG